MKYQLDYINWSKIPSLSWSVAVGAQYSIHGEAACHLHPVLLGVQAEEKQGKDIEYDQESYSNDSTRSMLLAEIWKF